MGISFERSPNDGRHRAENERIHSHHLSGGKKGQKGSKRLAALHKIHNLCYTSLHRVTDKAMPSKRNQTRSEKR